MRPIGRVNRGVAFGVVELFAGEEVVEMDWTPHHLKVLWVLWFLHFFRIFQISFPY